MADKPLEIHGICDRCGKYHVARKPMRFFEGADDLADTEIWTLPCRCNACCTPEELEEFKKNAIAPQKHQK